MLNKTQRGWYNLCLNFTYWKLTHGEIKNYSEVAEIILQSLYDFKAHKNICHFGISPRKGIPMEALEPRHFLIL